MLNLLPQLNPNPAMNVLYWVALYLIAGVYFVEQLFHPFRDGECPGDETNEKLIMTMVVVAWPIVVVSLWIGAMIFYTNKIFRSAWKFISKLFS